MAAGEKDMARAFRFTRGLVLKGPAFIDLESMDKENGFECWRMIMQRQKPVTGGALRSERRKLLDPEGNPQVGLPPLEDFSGTYFNQLGVWKRAVEEYDERSDEPISTAEKLAVLQRMS